MSNARLLDTLKPFEQLYALIDEWRGRTPAEMEERIPCRRGCAYCCYQYVLCSVPEAMYVVSWFLESKLHWKALESLMPEVRRQSQIAMESNVEKWFRDGIPCIFLDWGKDNSCRVYARRPSVCRSYTVMIPEGWRDPRCGWIGSKILKLDTTDVDLRVCKTSSEIGNDLRIWSSPMPLPVSVNWAYIAFTEGIQEVRRRMKTAYRVETNLSGTP